jgi:hypothetical protein
MDSKFDLPAAISKLHYTTTKLRPRDGPTLQWRNEFVDLLAINALTDYTSLPPPSRLANRHMLSTRTPTTPSQHTRPVCVCINTSTRCCTAYFKGAWTSAARTTLVEL